MSRLHRTPLFDRVLAAIRARRDGGPIVAHLRGNDEHTWWTETRVYSQDPFNKSVVSLPRNPPPRAVLPVPMPVPPPPRTH